MAGLAGASQVQDASRRRAAPSRVGTALGSLTAAHVVYAATAVYAACFAAAAALRYASFNAGRFDLGNMVQAVWSTSEGRFLESTAQNGEQFSRLGVHVEPILALFALLWKIWPSPLVLVTIQAVALSLGALPVFWLARKHLGSPRLAARFAFAYLLYPSTQWNAHFDFHAVSLAVPLLLFAIWYLDEDRFLAFLPFALLAVATKEHIGLLVGWLGIWYAVRKGRKALGAAVAVAGVAASAVALFVVMPHFAPAGVDQFAERYAHLGGSPSGVAKTLLTDPLLVLGEVTTRDDIGYLLILLAPFCGLWALSPLLAAGAVPQLALDLLSSKPEQTAIMHQYSAAIAPFVVAAAVLGAARLSAVRVRRWSRFVVVAAAVSAVASPLWFVRSYVDDLRSPAQSVREAAVQLIPADAPVTATNKIAGHLSERRRVFGFPNRREAEWLVIDLSDPTLGDVAAPRHFARVVASVERDSQWRLIWSREGISVFQRR